MAYLKVSGIVIKEVQTGDADKIVTLFTKSHGKVQAFAKGARRTKSPFAACTQLLCYSDMILFKGKEMYNLSSCEIVESFYSIRNDVERLTYCSHITEIINDVVQEEQPSYRLLQLYLNTLYMMSKENKSSLLLTRIFELRMLSILGYAPHVKTCKSCNKEDELEFFSFKNCSLICSKCLDKDNTAVRLSKGAVKALQYIVHAPLKSLFSFEVSKEIVKELSMISTRYLKERLEKDYKILQFLHLLSTHME